MVDSMKNVLFTGGSGFIGRNVINGLKEFCYIFAPTREELNLLDCDAVKKYIIDNKIQVVINSANPNPVKNQLDKKEKMFEDSIRIFLNLYDAENYYEKMITFGSGAEYDKSLDIDKIKEIEFGRSIPKDTYGLIKYTINLLIEKSEKQFNLRLFAVYGPTDHESKFITHVIRSILRNEIITIRKDCKFDYMQVMDLIGIIRYFIYNNPKYNTYNVATGKDYYLSEIAEMIKEEMNSSLDIKLLSNEVNKAYTADNSRLLEEINDYEFTPLVEGIKKQIQFERDYFNAQKSC